MKIKCDYNNFLELSDPEAVARIKKVFFIPDGQLNLAIGSSFEVHALLIREGAIWYYICSDDDYDSLNAYPAELFTVINAMMPDFWSLPEKMSIAVDEELVISFPEWSGDRHFYERFVVGDPSAIETFIRYKDLSAAASQIT